MSTRLPDAPVCPIIESTFEEFGTKRSDPYYWLREKENPKVRAYVEEENRYFDLVTEKSAEKRNEIFSSLKNLVEPVAVTPPYPVGDRYLYGSRTPEGKEYPIYFRSLGTGGPEKVTLDLNQLAEGLDHCSLLGFDVSPDDRFLAYSLDTDGSEHGTISIKDLESGDHLSEKIPDTQGSVAWSADRKFFFYSKINSNDRPDRVYRHQLGTQSSEDVLIYQEQDSRFFVDVDVTADGAFIAINSHSKESSEILLLNAHQPLGTPKTFLPKRENHTYTIERFRDGFLVLTNRKERNFDLYFCPDLGTHEAEWKIIREGSADVDLREIVAFEKFFALKYAVRGQHQIDLIDTNFSLLRTLTNAEAYYSLNLGANYSYRRDWIRCGEQSMQSLPEVFEVNAFTGERRTLHRTTLNGYDSTLYSVERFEATAEDGTLIPVIVMYRKDRRLSGAPMPTLLYGYGAYGIPNDARFSAQQIAACDLGFIWAFGLVRGGGELGQRWYDEGKFLKKKNSFSDFRDCALGLIEKGYSRGGEISIYGGSAGGLLVTATMNLAPELFRSVVALVPFVDVLNTMLDESLPLTPIEFDEWGNPKEEHFYRAIQSYSPYDNLAEDRVYPHLLMICGWNDPRVTYWEPAKFVAKMRAITEKLKDAPKPLILLKTHMSSGHGGASGRFEYLKDPAEILAFLLTVHA
jgi:oligopeptidase B